MLLRRNYLIFLMILSVIVDSEEQLRQSGHVQGGKCPYSVIGIESTFGHPVSRDERSLKNVWGFVTRIYEKIFGSKDNSQDGLHVLPPPTGKYNDCQNVPPSPLKCDPSYPYRTYDGTCNNLRYPTWGRADECQLRLLPAYYEGADGFRKSVNGQPLPEPRELSLNILPDVDHPSHDLSHMFVLFGQFVVHDLMLTPTPTRNIDGCCPYNARNRARIECAPIFIKPDDPFFSPYNRTCIPFERTNECLKCKKTGKIQKINRATAALDLNLVYGTNEDQADELRMKDGTGRLRFEIDNTAEILPRNIGMFSNFCPINQSSMCFFAGDDRVDQHSTLTSMHTLFLREHNRLATKLKELNPHWQEETLYQEARKIFVGQWQNMIYAEYLPFALGPRHMTHFGLWVGQDRTKYNSSARIGTFLEVSTAGFRLHSTVPSFTGTEDLRFYETFSNPSIIREGCIENLLEGACRVASQEFDRFFVEDVSLFFVKQPEQASGLDTGSIDIQRGRDNGLPPYVKMVEYLTDGQTEIASFDDLKVLMPQKHIELLKKYYDSVDDVDLWLGLQLEEQISQSSMGFNSATMSALQFHYQKYGDRFYFEHKGEKATSFTEAQLSSLRQTSFSRLICDNTNVDSIQRNALILPSSENPIVVCDEIPKIDLKLWKTDS